MILALLGILMTVAVPQAVKPPVRPAYVQPMPNGTAVDWLNGHAQVVGRVRIFRDLQRNPVNYKITQAEAEREGYARISAALKEIPLNASSPVGDQAEVLKRFAKRLDQVPADTILQDRGQAFRVVVKAPLWGEGGLMSLVLPDRGIPEAEDEESATTASMRGVPRAAGVVRARQAPPATGLVIDARQLEKGKQVAPALLPRIVDTAGRVVYGVDVADHDFAREYGMAVYQAPSAPGSPPLPSGREGSDPIEVAAVDASGPLRADIVIAPDSADRILEAAAASKFLEECRVLVLMPHSPPPTAIVTPPVKPAPKAAPRPPGKE